MTEQQMIEFYERRRMNLEQKKELIICGTWGFCLCLGILCALIYGIAFMERVDKEACSYHSFANAQNMTMHQLDDLTTRISALEGKAPKGMPDVLYGNMWVTDAVESQLRKLFIPSAFRGQKTGR